MQVTADKLKRAFDVVRLFAEAIRQVKQVPSGVLYAQVMGQMDLATYESAIDTLVRCQLVKRDAFHMLHWIGPTGCEKSSVGTLAVERAEAIQPTEAA